MRSPDVVARLMKVVCEHR